MTVTLYKGTEDNFLGPSKAYAPICRCAKQKLISPNLRKNNLYPHVPPPVCCLQAWWKIGQNQLKSWGWLPWNVWLYYHYQSRDEKNMLINTYSINTKMCFFRCHSDQASEEYPLLIFSELWSWSTTGIALCKGAEAHPFLLGYCLLTTIRGFSRENKVGVSERPDSVQSLPLFSPAQLSLIIIQKKM